MTIKRMLLLLRSYPALTPETAVGTAVDVAVALDARISALSVAILPHVPGSILSGLIGGVSGLVSAERQKTVNGAKHLLQVFSDLAGQRGVLGDAIYRQCAPSMVPELLAGYARVNDLTIMPMPEGDYVDQLDSNWYLEAALFQSGRPILVLPHADRSQRVSSFGTVVVAWDHTRAAARALADAMPVLRRAKSVRLFTITNEKPIAQEPPALEVVSYLAAHGIQVAYDAVDADGRDAATAIVDYLRAQSGDLLVMGGYGHSRLQELVLGGATRDLLAHPPAPIFMSH
jgi:nucleotide-binding universal stress UspA family protein